MSVDAKRFEKIKKICETINKGSFGGDNKDAVTYLSAEADNTIKRFSSGHPALDKALGGGYPIGRFIEIYGPEASGKSTTCLHAIAEFQKAFPDDEVALIDTEYAFDPVYADALGVHVDRLLLCQPDNGEQALNVLRQMMQLGVKFAIVDSVAALVPKAELEGDLGDHHVGRQARLMSAAMRILTSEAGKADVTVIWTNQIREKIGVTYGCFHYDTLVNFADGRSIPIGKIVDEKIEGKIWCYDEKEKKIVAKNIIDYHDNGKVETKEDFIHIETNAVDSRGGKFGFTCTTHHKILTNNGWKKAKDVSFGDKLITRYRETINGNFKEFLSGVLIADSHLSVRAKRTACLRVQDNENPEYVKWKVDKLTSCVSFNKVKVNQGLRYDTSYSYELAKIKKDLGERNPLWMLNDFSNLSLALWVMDNGHFDNSDGHCRYILSVKRFKNDEETLLTIENKLKELGLPGTKRIKDGSFSFNVDTTKIIAEKICQFIPDCMQYKLPVEFRGRYEDFVLSNSPSIETTEVDIIEIRNASSRQMRNKRKFDISVEDCYNYMVGGKNNGVIVHNSPETTPGGKALKFYTSIRMSIRRVGGEKGSGGEEEFIGNQTVIETKKNKTYPPFKKAKILITFGKGFDLISGLFDEGIALKILIKKSSWIKDAEGNVLGQGKPAIVKKMEEEPEFLEWLETEIKKANESEGEVAEVKEEPKKAKKKPRVFTKDDINIEEV